MIFFIVFTFQKSGEKCLEIWWVLQCAGACSAFTCWWYPRHCEGTHRAPKTIFSLRGLSYLLVRNVKRLLSIKRFLHNLFLSMNGKQKWIKPFDFLFSRYFFHARTLKISFRVLFREDHSLMVKKVSLVFCANANSFTTPLACISASILLSVWWNRPFLSNRRSLRPNRSGFSSNLGLWVSWGPRSSNQFVSLQNKFN